MKKLYLTLAFALMELFFCVRYGISAQAASNDGENLYVYTKDVPNVVVYSLDNLDKLTFGDNSICIWTLGGRKNYEYTKISLMTFCENIKPTTSIKPLIIDEAGVKIAYERSSSLMNVESEHILHGVAIYDLQGRSVVMDTRKLSSYQVSLLGMPQGVYVVKIGDKGKSTMMRIVK